MSNFCYVAFAINRISLIGKDQNKLVEFVSQVKIKNYLVVTGIISVCLSIVKAFKYQINYDHSELNYPYLIESDLYENRGWTRDVYFGANLISDMFNYLFFVLVNISFDFVMLVRLRKTLKEKLDRFVDVPNQEKMINDRRPSRIKSKKLAEVNQAINNAVRMVIFNSAVNFLFKLPLVFIPLQNVIAAFYFKSHTYENHLDLRFDNYIKDLTASDMITLVAEWSEFLFNFLISIQIFIYLKFDLKLKEAFLKRFIYEKNKLSEAMSVT